MPITSGQISQGFSQQQAMFGGQMAYAQQLSYPMQASLNPGMPPPPPPQAPQGPVNYGMAGERMMTSGMQTAGMVGSTALAGAQIYGMMGGGGMMGAAGRALDPFTHVMSAGGMGARIAGRMGMGMVGRGAMGAAFGASAALPMYAAYKAAETYGSAFIGGMQDQAGLNSQLRSNFQHFGGQGQFGRGFSQQQMGQIGMDVAQTVRNDPTMSMGQANQLIGQGAQSGMFTGVQGVSEFNQKFRQMLDTLKGVQRELGGSLNEAMQFVTEARQSGVFQTADRLRLAAGQRTTSATTGLNAMQQAQMTQFGAQLSRSVGGRAAQGAFGAQRAMQHVGAAVQSGALNEEQIFEMTGQTGAQGQMAMSQSLMQTTARLSRRAHGRYGIFGLANREGTGIDATQMARFAAGDIGVGELSRRAHRNVGRMGRARAINQEGRLRGAALEEGGVGFQIGMMRQVIGDRALSQGDDFASLVLQRRFGVERPQAEAMMSMMRNQGAIMRQEDLGRVGAARQASSQRQIQERGMDATMDRLGQTMSNRLGVTGTREMGQRAMTRISSLIEKAMNDMLGVVDHQMTGGTAAAMSAAAIGRASRGQSRRIRELSRASGEMAASPGGGGAGGRGMLEMPVWMGGRRNRQEALEQYGFNVSGYGSEAQRIVAEGDMFTRTALGQALDRFTGRDELRSQIRAGRTAPMTEAEQQRHAVQVSMAQQGVVTGGARDELVNIAGDDAMQRRIREASAIAYGRRQRAGLEGTSLFDVMEEEGSVSTDQRLAITAQLARQGTLEREGLTDPSGMRGGEGVTTPGMYARDALRASRFIPGVGGAISGLAQLTGVAGGTRSEVVTALSGGGAPQSFVNRHERAMRYISAGGILRRGASASRREDLASEHQGTGREAFAAAYQDETIGGLIDEITAASDAGDTEAVQRGIQNLRQHGNTLEGSQGRAVASITRQMEQEADRYNGHIGGHHRIARTDPEDVQAMRQESQAAGRANQRIASSITGNDRMSQMLRNMVSQTGTSQRTEGQEAEGYENQERMMESIAMMSESDQQEAMAILGGGDLSGTSSEMVEARARRRAMMGEQARMNAQQRDLTGGRGGRRQGRARDTALGMITGNQFGSMEFTTVDGRRLRGNRARDMMVHALSGQGRMSEEQRTHLRRQLVRQMEASGISGAEDLVQQYSQGLSANEGEGRERLSSQEARDLREVTRDNSGTIDRARQEALQRQQERDHPLDSQRNQTLTEILAAIQANKDDSPTPEGDNDRGGSS